MRTIYGKDGPKRAPVHGPKSITQKVSTPKWFSRQYLALVWAKRPAKLIAMVAFSSMIVLLIAVFAAGTESNSLSFTGGITSNVVVGSDGKVRLSNAINGIPVATFTAKQSSSSLLNLDANGSVGSLTWEIDHGVQPESNTKVSYGPLKVGAHHIKLTATTSNGLVSTERDVDVAWIAEPLADAQHDNVNGFPESGLGLPQWSPLPPIGPWRNKGVLNEATPQGDGIPRIVSYTDGSVSLLTKYGDHPGLNGGYRSNMELNNAYDGTLAGYPLGAKNIDSTGEGNGDGHSGSVRFYRVEFMLPSTNPNPLLYQNNFFELHGNINGSSPVRIQPNGSGTSIGIAFESIARGVSGGIKLFDQKSIQWNTWYNYVIEVRFDLDPTVGYIRAYRDGAVVTNVPGGTDSQGRYFATTQQTDQNGNVVLMAAQMQNYRTKANMPPDYPDSVVHYRKIRIGPTMASVMAL